MGGCAVINAAGGQPLSVVRPSVDMAVQYKPAVSQLMTRRAMMAGTVGLGVAASNGAAVAAEGTPEFRPSMPAAKQAIPGIPKTIDGAAMPETLPPDFLPKAAVLAGVLTRVKGLGDTIDRNNAAMRTPKSTMRR